MFDIIALLPGKKRRTTKGWYSFNAVCCHHRGHNPDKRHRGGIILDGDNWSYHCFNCDYKCKFELGRPLSYRVKQLLRWLGVEDTEINKWGLESLKYRDLIDYTRPKKIKSNIKFKETKLPDAEMIDPDNPDHARFIDYLKTRGMSWDEYPFLVTPDEPGRNANRIIVPYTFQNKIVGHISRYLDDRTPKYIKEQPPGYVFGYDFQKPEWESCLVFEGIFDALTLNGCALTHETISEEQADVLKTLNRRIVVVPDQDKTGLDICAQAMELGFYVSLPHWGDDIKDANDAVVKYGRLPTLLSILQSATNSRIRIEMQRKRIAKRL